MSTLTARKSDQKVSLEVFRREQARRDEEQARIVFTYLRAGAALPEFEVNGPKTRQAVALYNQTMQSRGQQMLHGQSQHLAGYQQFHATMMFLTHMMQSLQALSQGYSLFLR